MRPCTLDRNIAGDFDKSRGLFVALRIGSLRRTEVRLSRLTVARLDPHDFSSSLPISRQHSKAISLPTNTHTLGARPRLSTTTLPSTQNCQFHDNRIEGTRKEKCLCGARLRMTLSTNPEGSAYSRSLQKGGDPAAGSPTATLLRLRPSHRACLRPLPPCG